MRVSHRNRFTFMIGNMNNSLAELMELNIQASSQKRINRPSDDPVGAARVLNHRDSIQAFNQYRTNVDTAKGWLGSADNTLMQVNTILTRLRELGEQAATGTVGQENREQISYEARQLFDQLINLSNTEFEGKHIFGGHKTGESAFQRTLWMTTNDANVSGQDFNIQGVSDRTVLVRFKSDGTIGGGADLDYEYSTDGGQTFTSATLAAGDNTLDLSGVRLTLENGTVVSAVNPDVSGSDNNGTWIWLRPTARYNGDDVDDVVVDTLSGSTLGADATGTFPEDVVVRIDEDSTLSGAISYSYSIDGGINWTGGNTATASSEASNALLVVPGGYLSLSSNGGNALSSGDQFSIRPRSGKIMIEISSGEKLQINEIGKDIFGGVYTPPGASNASVVFGAGDSRNMFDAVGRMVGYLETNNQSGVQQALDDLRGASQHMLTSAARVGARENRLDVADNVLETLKLNEEERLSKVEDIDVTELMTKLANQQLVYETVLRSSSMVMRMSLANYM